MKILILGGHGVIGTPLVKLLRENHTVFAPPHSELDLLDKEELNDAFIYPSLSIEEKPEVVINLAAKKTNISLCKTNPVEIYRDTVQMGLNIFEACHIHKIPRLIQCVCSCSYAPTKLLKEDEFDKGPVDPSVESHGYAKRQLYYMAKFYRQEYGLVTNTICFNNVYGYLNANGLKLPYQFNTDGYGLKALDALFVKIVTAKGYNKESVEIFGTGKPRREFIYYEDVARAIEHIVNLEDYKPEHYNHLKSKNILIIGCQEDISIKKLANLIKKKIGYKGKLVYDKSKPDGQLRKLLDSSTFRFYFPEFKFTSLEEGIDKMIEAYAA